MKTYALCSPELNFKTRGFFNQYNIICIDIPPCPRLQAPVCTHPDMLFFKLSDSSLLTEKQYYDENREFFASLPPSLKIKTSSVELEKYYPRDIAFDALKVESTLFCLENYTAREILSDAEKTVNVKQGYAKCSSLLLESAVITADKSIHNAVASSGFDCALIAPEGISLNGYNCGFIGGASAVIEQEKAVIFFGNISAHPSFDIIRDFCEKKGYKLHFDCSSYPTDLGGALLFSV